MDLHPSRISRSRSGWCTKCRTRSPPIELILPGIHDDAWVLAEEGAQGRGEGYPGFTDRATHRLHPSSRLWPAISTLRLRSGQAPLSVPTPTFSSLATVSGGRLSAEPSIR